LSDPIAILKVLKKIVDSPPADYLPTWDYAQFFREGNTVILDMNSHSILIEFQESPPDYVEVSLTFTDEMPEGPYATSPWLHRFKNVENLIRFLDDNFDTCLDVFQKWMLRNRKSVYTRIDFDSAEYFTSILLKRSIESDLEPIDIDDFPREIVHNFVDATMNDFAGESCPRDFNFELVDFVVKESQGGLFAVFYFLVNPDDLDEIVGVHFLSDQGRYLRLPGKWKLMNPEEWNRQDNTHPFLIDPRRGRDFLLQYDRGLLDYESALEFSMNEEQANEFFSIHNSHVDLDDFEVDRRVHVYEIRSQEKPGNMSEMQQFDIEGGKLIIREREWAVLAAHPSWDFVTDFPSIVQAYCSDLPFLIPDRLSAEDWVNELNSLSPSLFRINPVPIRSEHGQFETVLSQVYSESKSTHGVAIIQGEK